MIPHIVSKLDGLTADDDVRVTTTDGYEVDGTVETADSTVDEERPRDCHVYAHILISPEAADDLGAVFCYVSVLATRLEDGWTIPDVEYAADIDDSGTEEHESLGELESIERID
ncbi:hypothetical protein [Candidatus Halobonum tyrrellensis]|uniref:Uncharacterized protein n=1 Tax=Candidatus Halobonum tyrrellensis G22 TaxID=1324957 RepID=V4HKE2_9EURY|nr:hypothetical protein [Candidatus Halobonum tyrrellensis]ESP88369.1 hypothetical protein K933_09607 [Candidatus Halobonum tyrrellensis G22]